MTDKSQLKQYRGTLTAAEVAEGIAAAQANSARLLEDAKLLLEAERYPSATALAILAMEERGKVVILKRLALVSEPADVREAWSDYRSHRAKNCGWIIPQLVASGARTADSLRVALDSSAEHTFMLDAVKQVSFYTDCCGDRHWSIPADVVDADLARAMVGAAEIMWGSRPLLVREMELWASIVGPAYNTPGLVHALIRFHEARVAEGLTDTSLETFEAFMRGEPFEMPSGRSVANRDDGEPF